MHPGIRQWLADKLNVLYSLITNIHQANVQILKNQKEIMTALIDAKLAANQALERKYGKLSGRYSAAVLGDSIGITEAQADTDDTLKQITGE